MIFGDRLRALRESKKLSQGDIEKRTGLFRAYISRVENGHSVPQIETLEKLACALEVPLYQIFYDGEKPPQLPNLPMQEPVDHDGRGTTRKEAHELGRFRHLLAKMNARDRQLLLAVAQKMAERFKRLGAHE